MQRVTIVIVYTFLLCTAVRAQHITVVESTMQRWAGGVCCRYGVNYHFKILFQKFRQEPILDTVWINSQDFPIFSGTKDSPGNLSILKSGRNYTFTFNPAYVNDDMPGMGRPDGRPVVKEVPRPAPTKYEGAALLSYHAKGRRKRYFYVVPSIKELEQQNYP